MPDDPAFAFRGINKSYGATVALADVSLAVRRGSVHALVGENGAGKSTLGKVLAGLTPPDSGEVSVAGRPVSFGSPRQALQAGVTMIAQELSLVPGRTVAENVFLGIESHRGPFVRRREILRRFSALAEASGIDVSPSAIVGDLRIAEQQKVEILRALARQANVIVMDEPTARLSYAETRALLATVRALAEQQTTILFVSHFLDEVLLVADEVTVMRDARVVGTRAAADESRDSLIEGMTGRPLDAMFPHKPAVGEHAEVVLSVHGLGQEGAFEAISFDVRAGEIVVLSGLVGSGRTEVLNAVQGARPADAGTMTLGGLTYQPTRVRDALDRGIAAIPESRKDLGLVLDRSVRDNVMLPYLAEVERLGWVVNARERELAGDRMQQVGVKAASPDQLVSTLSGGNQQKVLFARALVREPLLLLADEPTRGVDVGAKRSIYDLLAAMAAKGTGVLVVSSEIEEVMGLAHRILVMSEGRIVAEFDGGDVDEETVIRAAFGSAGGTS